MCLFMGKGFRRREFRGAADDGAYSARGIFGQFIYINPKHNIISVVLSARSKPKYAESVPDNDFWNAAVAALR